MGTTSHGSLVALTFIKINRMADLNCEVFGQVLHILCYPYDDLLQLIADINDVGYGLKLDITTQTPAPSLADRCISSACSVRQYRWRKRTRTPPNYSPLNGAFTYK